MKMREQLERLQKWACSKSNNCCEKCSYSVHGGRYLGKELYFCTIGITADAVKDRAKKEVENNNGDSKTD